MKWLITSRVRRKLMVLFIQNATHSFYLRQIAREINESAPAVRQELTIMCRENFIKSHEQGKFIFYQLNLSYKLLPILTNLTEESKEETSRYYVPTEFDHLMFLKQEFVKIKKQLISAFNPIRITLFGSLIHEHVTKHSDIDILIVMNTDKPFLSRACDIIDAVNYDATVDFLVYTPEEFELACKTNSFFGEEIIKKGKVVYEKAA